jgi:LacI family transcriptional regulator
MGFDDIDAATLVSPSLTTMATPSLEIGRAVGRTLLQRLGHEADDLPPHELVLPATLRARESA